MNMKKIVILALTVFCGSFASASHKTSKNSPNSYLKGADSFVELEPEDGSTRCTYGKYSVNCNSKLGLKFRAREQAERKSAGCSSDESMSENFKRARSAYVASQATDSGGSLSDGMTSVIIGAGFPANFYRENNNMYDGVTYYVSSSLICHVIRNCRHVDLGESSSRCEDGTVQYQAACAPKLKHKICN